jgi:4'-phosphopantetheinyl transferase
VRIDAKPCISPPPLAAGEVHVWVAELTLADFDSKPQKQFDVLDEDERQRAARFSRRSDGAQWASSRALLRELLGGYLACDPAALRFALGEYGKPNVLPPWSLHFNLSHSGGFALYAVALDQPVGVDVETLDRDLDSLALARRVFDDDSVRQLSELPPTERKREFIRLWVRHEASLKCLGLGLGNAKAFAQPWVVELDMADGVLAALAARSEPRRVVYNRLSGSLGTPERRL